MTCYLLFHRFRIKEKALERKTLKFSEHLKFVEFVFSRVAFIVFLTYNNSYFFSQNIYAINFVMFEIKIMKIKKNIFLNQRDLKITLKNCKKN